MTVFGGLTFGGGPIGNYMSHVVACMVEKLRETGGIGLMFANGGYATHNHTLLLTKAPQPEGTFPQDFDLQSEVDALRGAVPAMVDDYAGPAMLETYTILYHRDGAPRHGVVVARIDAGQRCLAMIRAANSAAITRLETGNPALIGTRGRIAKSGDHLIWAFD